MIRSIDDKYAMRISRVYLDRRLKTGHSIALPRDRSHYVINVLRIKKGDAIKLFNNTGYDFDARLVDITKKSARFKILGSSKNDLEPDLKITLALALSRGAQMDYALRKAVELGVDEIVPLITEFTAVRLEPSRLSNKLSHWKKIIISAAEQCGRSKLANLSAPVDFKVWIKKDLVTTRLIMRPQGDTPMQSIEINDNKICLIIGPEGGFSQAEIKFAERNNFRSVSLGPRVLRVETAVVSSLSLIQYCWGDLNGGRRTEGRGQRAEDRSPGPTAYETKHVKSGLD